MCSAEGRRRCPFLVNVTVPAWLICSGCLRQKNEDTCCNKLDLSQLICLNCLSLYRRSINQSSLYFRNVNYHRCHKCFCGNHPHQFKSTLYQLTGY